jgi:hypothetical protein
VRSWLVKQVADPKGSSTLKVDMKTIVSGNWFLGMAPINSTIIGIAPRATAVATAELGCSHGGREKANRIQYGRLGVHNHVLCYKRYCRWTLLKNR